MFWDLIFFRGRGVGQDDNKLALTILTHNFDLISLTQNIGVELTKPNFFNPKLIQLLHKISS